jgi:hypothetical protein
LKNIIDVVNTPNPKKKEDGLKNIIDVVNTPNPQKKEGGLKNVIDVVNTLILKKKRMNWKISSMSLTHRTQKKREWVGECHRCR